MNARGYDRGDTQWIRGLGDRVHPRPHAVPSRPPSPELWRHGRAHRPAVHRGWHGQAGRARGPVARDDGRPSHRAADGSRAALVTRPSLVRAVHDDRLPHTMQPGAGGGIRTPYVRAETGGPHDAGPVLERLYAEHPRLHGTSRSSRLVFEAACQAFGSQELESTWLFDEVYPGSRIGSYMSILHETMLFDLVGAFDPAFSRQDAPVGEWWLIQPESPRLQNAQLAGHMGLELAGYLPIERGRRAGARRDGAAERDGHLTPTTAAGSTTASGSRAIARCCGRRTSRRCSIPRSISSACSKASLDDW